MLIGLVRPLSANESAEDTIRGRHPGTNVRQNGVVLILLALFIPWNQLPEKFHSYRALLGTYRNYYWNIWKNAIGGLEEYAQYAAKNILQIKKSQLDAKLDRNLRNAAKNRQATDVDTFNNEDNNADDREKEGEEEQENDMDVPTVDSYSHVVVIIRIYQ